MPLTCRYVGFAAGCFLALTLPTSTPGQSSDRPSTASQAPTLPFSFSGVMYLNYQYGGAIGKRSENKFDLARVYLNFRAASGIRDTVRVTLDVFQQTDASRDEYYRGWTMRVKYGYLQHDLFQGSGNRPRAFVRLGLIQTVMIEKEEQYWNRGLSPVAVEQAGFFSSADAGASFGLTLPNKAGEIYTTVTNGNGYASRETDRFKDFQARLTLSPWDNGAGPLKGLHVSPWVSIGGRESDFAARKGTVQPVKDARTRNRFGVFVGYRDARLALGANLARQVDVRESADTTVDVAPTARTVTGNLASVFGIVRPALFAAGVTSSPWSIVLRTDNVRPDNSADGTQRRYIVGSTWDLNGKTSITLDVQSVYFRDGLPGSASRTFFLHLISNF
ncbi:MAG TPA: hypothetical protein VF981_00960 [Gemmatimonadaceae bacterium]